MKKSQYRYSFIVFCLSTITAFVVCTCIAGEKESTLEESKASYMQADKELNALWKQIETKWKHTPRRLESLRWKQRRWIRYRDFFACEVLMRDYDISADTLKQNKEHWRAMASMTQERRKILQSILSSDEGPLQRTGKWTDGFGGSLQIVEMDDGKIAFWIFVARGPTHHTGSLEGVAQQNGQIIRYSDAAKKPKYKKETTWLTGIVRGDHIEIVSANAQSYCGARAYFDGDYYRVDDLSDAEKENVLKNAHRKPE